MSDLNEYHIKLIKNGLRAAEEGRFVSHAEMKRLIAKMVRRKNVRPRGQRGSRTSARRWRLRPR